MQANICIKHQLSCAVLRYNLFRFILDPNSMLIIYTKIYIARVDRPYCGAVGSSLARICTSWPTCDVQLARAHKRRHLQQNCLPLYVAL